MGGQATKWDGSQGENMTTRKEIIQAYNNLWEAFLAGFMSSGEGWNGECPMERDATPENIAALKNRFEAWMMDPDCVDKPNWRP